MRPSGAGTDRAITVILADDEPHVLEFVRTVLELDGLVVVGMAHDADGAVRLARGLHPDVAILDLYMPGGGLAAAQLIGSSSPRTHVMVFSGESDARQVLPLLRVGIDGYVVKGCSPDRLTEAVRDVVAGAGYLAPEVTQATIAALASRLREEEEEVQRQGRQKALVVDTIEQSRFTIECQPIHDLGGSALHAVEALARFSGPPIRTPGEWFADASDVGLRTSLEIATAASALALLPRLRPDLRLMVNISPAGAASGRLDALLASAPLERIVFELTEHAPVSDYEQLRAVLRPWRAQGARVAVDDAAGGYASFRNIFNLAPDYIKLDVDLTFDIDVDPERQALARALIGFAGDMGSAVIAEGVESAEQLETLQRLGADYAQGYHLGSPRPLDEQPALLVGGSQIIDLRPVRARR